MLKDKVNMTHEYCPHRRHGRLDSLGRPINTRQKALCHPDHDGLPQSGLGRKVPKQSTLGQIHVFGNC